MFTKTIPIFERNFPSRTQKNRMQTLIVNLLLIDAIMLHSICMFKYFAKPGATFLFNPIHKNAAQDFHYKLKSFKMQILNVTELTETLLSGVRTKLFTQKDERFEIELALLSVIKSTCMYVYIYNIQTSPLARALLIQFKTTEIFNANKETRKTEIEGITGPQ